MSDKDINEKKEKIEVIKTEETEQELEKIELVKTEAEETEAEETEPNIIENDKTEFGKEPTGKKSDNVKKKTLDDVYAGTEEINKISDSKKATAGLRIAGIMSIIMAAVGAVLVFICIYHLVIAPSYVKETNSNDLHFPYVHTDSDAYSYLVTPLEETATYTDSTGLDSTDSDAAGSSEE